jgi:transcriptional regulator with XRE-family HTH domain
MILAKPLNAGESMVYSCHMLINEKLRELRESKNLSQGDIEKRTGLLRCYTSRVENGHTVPSVETLEKYARALEVPLYKLFHDGTGPAKKPNLPATHDAEEAWGTKPKEHDELRTFAKALARLDDRQRKLLLHMASKMAARKSGE